MNFNKTYYEWLLEQTRLLLAADRESKVTDRV